MLLKKIYIPIGLCLVLLLAIGFLSLRSDVPTEPVKIYKVTTPDTPTKVTETAEAETTGGHRHADGTWHNEPHTREPHTEETAQEKFDREMREKMARKEQEIAKYEAETAKYKAELDTLKAKDAERTEYLSRITEKGKEFVAQFSDVLEMTPEKYLALSETEQEEFLLRCVEYDFFVEEVQGIVNSMPQWVRDELDDERPGEIDDFLNLPLLTELYGRL